MDNEDIVEFGKMTNVNMSDPTSAKNYVKRLRSQVYKQKLPTAGEILEEELTKKQQMAKIEKMVNKCEGGKGGVVEQQVSMYVEE